VLVAAGCLLLGSAGGSLAGAVITGKDIKNSSLTGKDVKDRSLSTQDLDAGATAALTGPAGAPGAPGLNAYQTVDGPQAAVPAASQVTLQVACPAGTTTLGGSYRTVSGTVNVTSGGPTGTGSTWELVLTNAGAGAASVVPYVVCTRA
jgi:hypothetical protein